MDLAAVPDQHRDERAKGYLALLERREGICQERGSLALDNRLELGDRSVVVFDWGCDRLLGGRHTRLLSLVLPAPYADLRTVLADPWADFRVF